MKLSPNRLIGFFVVLTFALILQSCAGSGNMAGNSNDVREYSQSFSKMTNIVERAIGNSNINIDFVSESDDKNKVTLTVSRDRYVNNEEVQQEQGEVRIIKVSDNKTRVEIDNPDYHFSVPQHQRKDYQRIIFRRIDSLLGK